MTAALAAALVLPGAAALAEEGDTGGGGGGGGHTDGTTGSLYSDLVIAYRAVDGTPILKEYFAPPNDEDPEGAYHFCVQPASYNEVPGLTAIENPLEGKDISVLPLQGEYLDLEEDEVPVAEIEPCDVQPQYSMYVSEAELERLNLGRTSEDVLDRKLADVASKLIAGDGITLDAAGRIAIDGAALDASPEYAAIYASLMSKGTVPGLPTADGLASIVQPDTVVPDFEYGPYQLAAVAIGTAASKSVPLSVDAVQYYNRVVGFAEADPAPDWGIEFLLSADPDGAGVIDRTVLPGKEKFVDFSDFSYNRSETFPGSATWLDVPTLTWKVDRILDVVDFTELSKTGIGDGELTGLLGFAQMADDARAVISYLHENDVIPGFYIDPVGVDTTGVQTLALTDVVVDLEGVPDNAFAGMSFPFTASLYNPWGSLTQPPVLNGELRLSIVGPESLTADQVTLELADGTALSLDSGLTAVIPMDAVAPRGYRLEQQLELLLGLEAPAGAYSIELELWHDTDTADGLPAIQFANEGTRLVEDKESFVVNVSETTLTWGAEVAAAATQGSNIPLPVRVFSPEAGDLGLVLSVAGPEGADPALAEGNVSLRHFDGTQMVSTPLVAGVSANTLTVGVSQTLIAGYNDIAWNLNVAEGAPVGAYTVDVGLAGPSVGSDVADPVSIAVTPPEDHKSPNAPVVVEKEIVGDTATIVVSSTSKDVAYYEFVVVSDFDHIYEVKSYDGSETFTDLSPGAYKVKVTAVDKAGNRSATVNDFFNITDGSTGGGGVITPPTTDPTTPADPGDGDPVVPPVDPEEPGDGAGEGDKPDTFVGKGPRNRSFVLGHSVTYRLRSTGEDVQYRVMLNNRFDQLCDSNVCVVDGLKSGKNVLRFAAQANGQRDDTPVVRKIYVPRNADALRMTKRWRIRENVRAFDGDLARTNQAGQVVRTRARDIKRIALVVARGKGNGQVEVYLGQRLLTSTPIDLSNQTNQHRVLVPVTTFRKLQTGFVRVKVVSQGEPVRIEGIGILNR